MMFTGKQVLISIEKRATSRAARALVTVLPSPFIIRDVVLCLRKVA